MPHPPAARPRSANRIASAVEPLEPRQLMSVNVTTYHYDNARDGANRAETTLTPTNVNDATFGKVASFATDGQAYAQPLAMTGVAVAGQGTRDIVLVATEADSVYAFDAHGNNPSQGYLWKTSLLKSGETTIPEADYGTTDITPQIGITGTPVVDASTGTLYVVGAFKEASGTYEQRLYALSLADGSTKLGGPVTLAASVAGTGDGQVGGKIVFSPFRENQRPALTLANGQIYIAWASHGDQGPFHGWVMAYSASTLKQTDVYCANPDGYDDGIWMSGGGLAVDASGDLYFTTGNGDFNANTGGSDYGMSIEKLTPSLAVVDSFTPYNEAALSSKDLDYGCAGVILLPTQTGSDPNQVLSVGKWGTIYLNDRDTGEMGGFTSGYNKDLSETNITSNVDTGNVHNSMSYWNGHAYLAGDGLALQAYSVGGGKLSASATSVGTHVFGKSNANGQGAGPTVSANGTSNGIVWAVDNTAYGKGAAVLYAYNANNVSQLLYSSDQAANGRDTAGTANKYQDAVVANGLVYVAGANAVTVYGLLAGKTPTPTPTATKLTGTLIGTSGSYANSGNTIARAADGNAATFFDAAAANGDWVGLDTAHADTVTSIAFIPRSGYESRMVGGTFQGSNSPQFTSGVTALYTVKSTPASGTTTTVPVSSASTFRYLRYLSPNGGYGDIAEFQFFGSVGAASTSAVKLTGVVTGTNGSYQNQGNTISKATDGNLSTFFDSPTANGDAVASTSAPNSGSPRSPSPPAPATPAAWSAASSRSATPSTSPPASPPSTPSRSPRPAAR